MLALYPVLRSSPGEQSVARGKSTPRSLAIQPALEPAGCIRRRLGQRNLSTVRAAWHKLAIAASEVLRLLASLPALYLAAQ